MHNDKKWAYLQRGISWKTSASVYSNKIQLYLCYVHVNMKVIFCMRIGKHVSGEILPTKM